MPGRRGVWAGEMDMQQKDVVIRRFRVGDEAAV